LPLVKRKLFVPCREDECFKLYELLKEKMPSVNYASFDVTEKGLLIEVYGYESDVKELWFEIKRLVGPLKEITRKSGVRKYSVDLITKMIKKTFPPRVLVEVLKRLNYYADLLEGENQLATNASFEEVVRLAEKTADLNNEASRVAGNTSTRNYIVALCIITGLSIDEIVKESLEQGLLSQNESGKYIVTRDWRSALDVFLKSTRR